MSIKMDWKDRFKVLLLLLVLDKVKVIVTYIEVFIVFVLVGYVIYVEFIAKEFVYVNVMLAVAVGGLICENIRLVLPLVIPKFAYSTALRITALSQIPAEELAKKFGDGIAESITQSVEGPERLKGVLKELVMCCIELAKGESRTGGDFVREYYTCLREACGTVFYMSEESFKEVLGRDLGGVLLSMYAGRKGETG